MSTTPSTEKDQYKDPACIYSSSLLWSLLQIYHIDVRRINPESLRPSIEVSTILKNLLSKFYHSNIVS